MPHPHRLLLALLTLAPAASSASETIAVVATGDCDGASLSAHARTVREALARRVGAPVLSAEGTARALGGLPRGSLASAARLLSDAEGELLAGGSMTPRERARRDRLALSKLSEAVEVLLSLPPSPERWKTLLRIRALQLRFYAGTGRSAELERTVEALLRVAPDYAFDPRLHSPAQLEVYEKVRKRVRERATATLKLTSHPAGMVLYVDGREVGPAPITMKVVPGTYRVEAAAGARRGVAHLVTVSELAEVDVDGAFERSVALEEGPCVEAGSAFGEREAMLARFGSTAGAQVVVGVRLERSRQETRYLAVESIESSTGRRRGGAALKLTDGKPASGALDALSDNIGVLPDAQRSIPLSLTHDLAPLPAPSPPPARWLRPAAFAAGGLALALAGVATYEGFSSRDSYRKADVVPHQGIEYSPADQARRDALMRDADSARTAMYVTAGVAVALAATAGVLGYLSREPEPVVIRF
jgi:hypothetical protein